MSMLQITKKMHDFIVLFLVMHLCKYISCFVLLFFLGLNIDLYMDFAINIIVPIIVLKMYAFSAQEYVKKYKANIVHIVFGVIYYTLLLDCIFTIHHYVMHMNQYLYTTVHYVHHSSTGTLTPIKGMLSHPFDGLSVSILIVFTIVTFEPNPISFTIAYSMFSVMGIFLHSGYNNEDMFWPFLVTPADHQRHHNCVTVNYGVFYSIWDRLSGTYSHVNC